MYYSQACARFVVSETTEVDTICDSEEEESIENGKHNKYSNCKVFRLYST
jgi:hypothetical protein